MASTLKLLEHLRSQSPTAPKMATARSKAFYRLYPLSNVVCPPLFRISSFYPSSRMVLETCRQTKLMPSTSKLVEHLRLQYPTAPTLITARPTFLHRSSSRPTIVVSPRLHLPFPSPPALLSSLLLSFEDTQTKRGLTLSQQPQLQISLSRTWSTANTTSCFSAATSRN